MFLEIEFVEADEEDSGIASGSSWVDWSESSTSIVAQGSFILSCSVGCTIVVVGESTSVERGLSALDRSTISERVVA
jgi:hypothetical protein